MYVLIIFYNIASGIILRESLVIILLGTVPFLIIPILYISSKRDVIDLLIDILLLIVLNIIAPMGTFSGIAFLYLIAYRCKEKKHYLLLGFFLMLSISANSIVNNFTLSQNFLLIVLYLFLIAKYYYKIHIPKQKLIEGNEHLKAQLFRFGPAESLKDHEILTMFPFMSMRRISDIRHIYDGKNVKELSYINGISYSAQDKETRRLMQKFNDLVEYKVCCKVTLIRACLELGIVKPTFRHINM
jgi:hypothetical protein